MPNRTTVATARANAPITCTLSPILAHEQVVEWADLQDRASEVAAIEGGARMTLPATMVDQVTDLAQREAECCAFLTIATSVADGILTLDLTSTNPDAQAVISALTGVTSL